MTLARTSCQHNRPTKLPARTLLPSLFYGYPRSDDAYASASEVALWHGSLFFGHLTCSSRSTTVSKDKNTPRAREGLRAIPTCSHPLPKPCSSTNRRLRLPFSFGGRTGDAKTCHAVMQSYLTLGWLPPLSTP